MPDTLLSVAQDFPLLDQRLHDDRRLVYLDSGASSPCPQVVLDRMTEVCQTSYANVHRGIHVMSERATALYEAARRTVAKFLNAASEHEVVFTSGTTGAINLVAQSWSAGRLQPGDEVLVTPMEHHSNLVPWFMAADRTGCVVKYAPLTEDGQLDLEGFARALSPRTRLVALTGMSNVLGTVPPLAEIARLAHAAGAVVLVDGAQSVPHTATDVQALGIDLLAFSGHKIHGPTGVGVLWGREKLLDSMPPATGGGGMIRTVTFEGFEPAGLPEKFEAGTPPIVPAIGLAAALDYVEAHGTAAIHAHEDRLVRAAYAGLAEIEGVRLLGPPPTARGPLVSFVIDRVHAHDVAQLLDREGIAVRAGHHCTMPLHKHLGIAASTRASFAMFNTEADVAALISAVVGLRGRFSQRRRRR